LNSTQSPQFEFYVMLFHCIAPLDRWSYQIWVRHLLKYYNNKHVEFSILHILYVWERISQTNVMLRVSALMCHNRRRNRWIGFIAKIVSLSNASFFFITVHHLNQKSTVHKGTSPQNSKMFSCLKKNCSPFLKFKTIRIYILLRTPNFVFLLLYFWTRTLLKWS